MNKSVIKDEIRKYKELLERTEFEHIRTKENDAILESRIKHYKMFIKTLKRIKKSL